MVNFTAQNLTIDETSVGFKYDILAQINESLDTKALLEKVGQIPKTIEEESPEMHDFYR